jgi:hypothetical protein
MCQAADFADHVASGALTVDFAVEVESLRAQHADAVREKSAAEIKSRRLSEKVAAMEAERADLRCQLAEERREANKAIVDAQAAQAKAKLARTEGSLTRKLAEELQARLDARRSRLDKAETSMRAEVGRTHAQFVDAYRELGARTAAFEAPDQEAGLRFLEWMQEELGVLPTIVTGLMSFASLVTYEGAVNALSREGCRHFEVFDQNDENFEREIFKVEDPVLKQSGGGALFDRMWGPHDREMVWERSNRAIEQVKASFCVVISGGVWFC